MMNIAYISLCGFRGYKNEIRIELASGFNIISGRNGVGKSTLCDAVEYALTGNLNKYGDKKSAGESVDQYIWWRGKEPAEENYIEVAFRDSSDNLHVIRRSKGEKEEPAILNKLAGLMYDDSNAPSHPFIQLCKSSIIRDEFISALSLDLDETKRFQLLREALGSTDSELETTRASELKKICANRINDVQRRHEAARTALKEAVFKIEQIRSRMVDDSSINKAVKSLQDVLSSNIPVDELLVKAREYVGQRKLYIENFDLFIRELECLLENRSKLSDLKAKEAPFKQELEDVENQIEETNNALSSLVEQMRIAQPEESVRILSNIIADGEKLGLQDGHCPLCNANHDYNSFIRGVSAVRSRLNDLSSQVQSFSALRVEQEQKLLIFRERKTLKNREFQELQHQIMVLVKSMERLSSLRIRLELDENIPAEEAKKILLVERERLEQAEGSLRILDTLSMNSLLESATFERNEADKKVTELETALSKARKADMRAKVIYDASRRAANEALDDRLDLIGPLLSDFYRRLRPHASWRDIEYKIRGDVKRFLSLEVGDGLNPQFIFSSGQRRATGLAFLLSIYLSTSWSRLKTIILDDPVQHIDDFRALHLAELLAALHMSGHQIICAVEDEALANLLCRRLPVQPQTKGVHIELGEAPNGCLGVLRRKEIKSLPSSVLTNFDC